MAWTSQYSLITDHYDREDFRPRTSGQSKICIPSFGTVIWIAHHSLTQMPVSSANKTLACLESSGAICPCQLSSPLHLFFLFSSSVSRQTAWMNRLRKLMEIVSNPALSFRSYVTFGNLYTNSLSLRLFIWEKGT